MQQPSRQRRRKEKSVFDASHFEESDDSGSSGAMLGRFEHSDKPFNLSAGTEPKQVRFQRSSTPSRSSRTRGSKPISRTLPTLHTTSFLLLPLLVSIFLVLSVTGLNMRFAPAVSAALNLTGSLTEVLPSSLFRTSDGQVPPHIADYVQRAISTALKSTIQRPDFALRTQGSIIVPSLTTSPDDLACEPDDVLDEDFGSPHCCFFPGDRGQIAVRLSKLVRPTHVAINYTPPTHTMVHHAPQHVVLWGLVDGAANKALFNSLSQFRAEHRSLGDGPAQSGRFVFLPFANFTFDIHASFSVQTFPIHSEIVFAKMSSGLYIVEVRSNWGGNSSGICRIHLHGEPAV